MKPGAKYASLLLLALVGCQPVPAVVPPITEPPAPLAADFRAGAVGQIVGQVVWEGEAPRVPPFSDLPLTLYHEQARIKSLQRNPNRPEIAPESRGVGNAVVFLRGVPPAASRPWDWPPVQVAIKDYRLQVQQGDRGGRYGFVRRGEYVEVVSRQPVHHMVRASGAACFNLALPEPDQSRSRPLTRRGVVELSNAIHYFWMRGYLFVDDHPYYACTDRDGRFVLHDVPPGQYDLVCWLPSWREAARDLDPELGTVLRLHFEPPVEKSHAVIVETGRTLDVHFEMRLADFGEPAKRVARDNSARPAAVVRTADPTR
ncbi:MAG: hypothetical protein JNM56_35800 [Planctomycetia bacterium]|nr:hypothetical protein [Planctomycetia bacterium]